MPSNLQLLIIRPWTVLTYMFLHWEFMHLIPNMLGIFWFGKILQEYLGRKKLLAIYLFGGLAGALLLIIAGNTLPLLENSVMLGASASAMAIIMATSTLLPDYEMSLLLIGPVKIKWIALAIFLLDLININMSNVGGHIAHIGGILMGFVFIILLRRGYDLSKWVPGFSGSSAVRRSTIRSSKGSDATYLKSKADKQERLDEILDKINRSGYGSLSQAERDFLFKISKDQ
jgi:membrane associated rhomboid family serine protease